MNIPSDLKYTAEHEWIVVTDGVARLGITDYAQDALGDVVYVDLPAVGSTVSAGVPVGEVESTKSVSDIYAPLSGKVTEVNEQLDSNPGKINEDPYGEGWMFMIELSNDAEIADLIDAAAYGELTSE